MKIEVDLKFNKGQEVLFYDFGYDPTIETGWRRGTIIEAKIVIWDEHEPKVWYLVDTPRDIYDPQWVTEENLLEHNKQ